MDMTENLWNVEFKEIQLWFIVNVLEIFCLSCTSNTFNQDKTSSGKLIRLIQTPSDSSDSLYSVGYISPPAAADASPKMSQRINKKMCLPNLEDKIEKSFDASATGMCLFRVFCL